MTAQTTHRSSTQPGHYLLVQEATTDLPAILLSMGPGGRLYTRAGSGDVVPFDPKGADEIIAELGKPPRFDPPAPRENSGELRARVKREERRRDKMRKAHRGY